MNHLCQYTHSSFLITELYIRCDMGDSAAMDLYLQACVHTT